MYVFLVLQDCCDGLLKNGDLLVYTERGYERFRGLPIEIGGAVGLAALEGKLECLHPGEAVSLEAHQVLKLAALLGSLRPAPADPTPASASGPAHPYLRLLR